MIVDKEIAFEFLKKELDTTDISIKDLKPFHYVKGVKYTSGSGTGLNDVYSNNSLLLVDVLFTHSWSATEQSTFEATLNGIEVSFLDDEYYELVNNGGGGQETHNFIRNIERIREQEIILDTFTFDVPNNITNITGEDVVATLNIIGWEISKR